MKFELISTVYKSEHYTQAEVKVKADVFVDSLTRLMQTDFITASEIDAIEKAIFDRKHLLAKSIQIGDTVEITGRMKPKYLVGVTATVTGKDNKNIWVLLNKNHPNLQGRKLQTSGTVGFPIGTVERVDSPSKEDTDKAAQISELVELGLMNK